MTISPPLCLQNISCARSQADSTKSDDSDSESDKTAKLLVLSYSAKEKKMLGLLSDTFVKIADRFKTRETQGKRLDIKSDLSLL